MPPQSCFSVGKLRLGQRAHPHIPEHSLQLEKHVVGEDSKPCTVRAGQESTKTLQVERVNSSCGVLDLF